MSNTQEVYMSATWKNRDAEKHRAYQRDRANMKREQLSQVLTEIKRHRGCDFCGFSDPRALIFVHRRDDAKLFDLNLRAWSRSMESILAEVEKCSVVCQNCLMIGEFRQIE
jgi:hypothetical protein